MGNGNQFFCTLPRGHPFEIDNPVFRDKVVEVRSRRRNGIAKR